MNGANEEAVAGLDGRPVGVVSADLGQRIDPATRHANAAVTAGRDLIAALVADLGASDFSRAATLTTGPARSFLLDLAGAQECGVEVRTAILTSPGSKAVLVGPGTFDVDASAVLALNSAEPRTFSSFEVKELGNSSWLISDFLVDGLSAGTGAVEPGSNVRAGLRLTPTRLCVGPRRIIAEFTVENESREPLLVVDAFYCDADGVRHDLAESAMSALTSTLVPPRSLLVEPWRFDIQLPTDTPGGNLVLYTPDADETRQEGELVYRRRAYPIAPSPLLLNKADVGVGSPSVDDVVGTTLRCQPNTDAVR